MPRLPESGVDQIVFKFRGDGAMYVKDVAGEVCSGKWGLY